MKNLLWLILVTGYVHAQDFSEYRWKNRLIVVSAENDKDSLAVNQINLLREASEEFAEYKLKLIFDDHAAGTNSQAVSKTNLPRKFKVELIGLDGQVKFSSHKLVPFSKFAELINAMPMRRSEQKNKNKE